MLNKSSETLTSKKKRNLTRHISERQRKLKHWTCIEVSCTVKFIRRGYLLDHLIHIHKYTRPNAKTAKLKAEHGNKQESSAYYENISLSDDDILTFWPKTKK